MCQRGQIVPNLAAHSHNGPGPKTFFKHFYFFKLSQTVFTSVLPIVASCFGQISWRKRSLGNKAAI